MLWVLFDPGIGERRKGGLTSFPRSEKSFEIDAGFTRPEVEQLARPHGKLNIPGVDWET